MSNEVAIEMACLRQLKDIGFATSWKLLVPLGLALLLASSCGRKPLAIGDASAALVYTNIQVPEIPWSIHVVRVQLSNSVFEVHSMHAGRGVLGLSTLTAQTGLIPPAVGVAVAGINGDFYERFKEYSGAPRGLQILERELLTGPSSGPTFWVDAAGRCHATNVVSLFRATWPGGGSFPFSLNQHRQTNGLVLYSPAIGRSTHTVGGREIVLAAGGGPWLPLAAGQSYRARVVELHDSGDTAVSPTNLVLSAGPALLGSLPKLNPGDILQLSTATMPNLDGAKTAISGGPLLITGGRQIKTSTAYSEDYEISSRLERHPRTAVGWSANWLFLVVVDGRQRDLSVGMTLDELSVWLLRLGCAEAMNFDGGGSATLWYDGKVQNSPCDQYERDIANSLIVVRRNGAITATARQ